MTFSPEQLALAQNSPAGLAYVTGRGKWTPANHLQFINARIVRAVNGTGPRRLVVECPPRHGKSELISHRTPAWYLGMFPDRQVMLASYGATLAESWGRKARDLLEEHGGALYDGVKIRADARAADRWYTDHGGVMAASGIGGRFTGMGADLLIIDDPVKDAEEARSQVIRDKHIDWWQSTAVTRLHPGAVVILLMTRWHEDDLGGYLLREGADDGGEPFTEIRLPAIAENADPLGRVKGEALWPERYPIELLEQRKRSVGTYWWSAMYQGRPTPEGGGMFQGSWFARVKAAPQGDEHAIRWVRYWDLAATEQTSKSSDPDWTVGALLGRTPGNHFYLADIKRVRTTPHKVEQLLKSTAQQDGAGVKVCIEQEPGSNAKIAVSHLIRNVLQGYDVRAVVSSKSKVVRADPVSAQAEAGNITLVEGPWVPDFVHEAEQFPNGSHDDQIDGLSGAYAALLTKADVQSTPYRQPATEPVIQRGGMTLRGRHHIDQT